MARRRRTAQRHALVDDALSVLASTPTARLAGVITLTRHPVSPMHQGQLFPDGFEILEQALVALKDIDLRRADEFGRRARASQPKLVNLDVVAAACDYLRHHLPDNPDPDACAAALLAVPADVEA